MNVNANYLIGLAYNSYGKRGFNKKHLVINKIFIKWFLSGAPNGKGQYSLIAAIVDFVIRLSNKAKSSISIVKIPQREKYVLITLIQKFMIQFYSMK